MSFKLKTMILDLKRAKEMGLEEEGDDEVIALIRLAFVAKECPDFLEVALKDCQHAETGTPPHAKCFPCIGESIVKDLRETLKGFDFEGE